MFIKRFFQEIYMGKINFPSNYGFQTSNLLRKISISIQSFKMRIKGNFFFNTFNIL